MKLLLCLFSLLVASLQLPAQPTVDPDLPAPFDPSVALPLLEASPFTRSLNLGQNLVLTGIAYVEGKPVAFILDTTTKQHHVVSEQPNSKGWKLSDTNAALKLDQTQARIWVGNEEVTVRYSKNQLAPNENPQQQSPGRGERGGGDGQRREGRRRGPDPAMRSRIEALPEESRRRLFEEMRNNRERLRGMSEQESSDFFRRQLERVERNNQR